MLMLQWMREILARWSLLHHYLKTRNQQLQMWRQSKTKRWVANCHSRRKQLWNLFLFPVNFSTSSPPVSPEETNPLTFWSPVPLASLSGHDGHGDEGEVAQGKGHGAAEIEFGDWAAGGGDGIVRCV